MANIAKMNSDQISEMLRLFEEGATKSSLAKRYDVSIGTISNKIKAAREESKVEEVRTLELRSDEPYIPPAAEGGVYVVESKKKESPKRRIVGVNI